MHASHHEMRSFGLETTIAPDRLHYHATAASTHPSCSWRPYFRAFARQCIGVMMLHHNGGRRLETHTRTVDKRHSTTYLVFPLMHMTQHQTTANCDDVIDRNRSFPVSNRRQRAICRDLHEAALVREVITLVRDPSFDHAEQVNATRRIIQGSALTRGTSRAACAMVSDTLDLASTSFSFVQQSPQKSYSAVDGSHALSHRSIICR